MTLWGVYLLVAFVSLVAAGVIKMIESALAPISKARVEAMVKDEVSGARALLRVVDSKTNHLSMLALVQMVLDTLAAVFALLTALELIESRVWAITAAILAVALLRFSVIGINAPGPGS